MARDVDLNIGMSIQNEKSTTKYTQLGTKRGHRSKKSSKRRQNQSSPCFYLIPERRKFVPLAGIFLLFCSVGYFKFTHIEVQPRNWSQNFDSNSPAYESNSARQIEPQAQNEFVQFEAQPPAEAFPEPQPLNLELIKHIDLGIDLDEPVSISRRKMPDGPLDHRWDDPDYGRPYKHDFGWYEDYYENRDMPAQVATAGEKGWILPMLYFDMGPNNLFRLLRQGAITAYNMGRGLTVPVFHRHPRMGDQAKNPFVLPIFDQNYTVDLVWPANETLDVGMLRKIMPVQPMKDMMSGCQKKLDMLIKCGDIDTKRYEGINHFQRAIDMEIVETVTIPTMADLDPKCCGEACDPNQPAKMNIDDKKCVGIVYGKKCLPDQDKWLQSFAEISRNFLRPTVIRRFAQEFTEKVIGNRPYLFVHWRYESDWLDMCKPSRPKGARERNKEICKLIMGLTYDEATRSMFVSNLKAKMTEFNLEVVYLASPPNNIDLIRLLNSSFPGNFFYMDDVGRYSNSTGTFGPGFLDNNYKASFVEQEIGFKSTFYLGASLSSWTQTVLTDRLARKNSKHDSVLTVVTNGAPGYPELVFQFPEGDFNFKLIKGKNV